MGCRVADAAAACMEIFSQFHRFRCIATELLEFQVCTYCNGTRCEILPGSGAAARILQLPWYSFLRRRRSSLLLRYNLERCAENKLAEKAAGKIEKKLRNLLKLWRFAWTKQYADEYHRFRIERRRDVKKPEKFGRSLFSLLLICIS